MGHSCERTGNGKGERGRVREGEGWQAREGWSVCDEGKRRRGDSYSHQEWPILWRRYSKILRENCKEFRRLATASLTRNELSHLVHIFTATRRTPTLEDARATKKVRENIKDKERDKG
uniref:Uncharacterized protein n=1 Tax=Vespula pensylvanica TaxID=30213 RepID=A0A834P9U7_VESPE|nr:hypothetical protein H0235_002436 [Vespula pensylvanica]